MSNNLRGLVRCCRHPQRQIDDAAADGYDFSRSNYGSKQ